MNTSNLWLVTYTSQHDIKATLYSVSSSCIARAALIHWGTDTRHLGCPLVSSIGMLAVDLVGWGVGPPWIRLVPACPTDARSDWDVGNVRARSTPWDLCHVPWLFLFYSVSGCTVLLGGALPSGELCCHEGVFLVHKMVFGWVVCVK